MSTNEMLKQEVVEIYTDGACKGNGRKEDTPGGFGAVLLHKGEVLEVKGAKANTTSNEMELAAIWAGLKQVTNTNYHFVIYLDSVYVMNVFEKWIETWRHNGFKTRNKKPIKNHKLIMLIDEQLSKLKSYSFTKVKGHTGVKWNERADALANEAIAELLNKADGAIAVQQKDSYGLTVNKTYIGTNGNGMILFEYKGNNVMKVLEMKNAITGDLAPHEHIIQLNNSLPLVTDFMDISTVRESLMQNI